MKKHSGEVYFLLFLLYLLLLLVPSSLQMKGRGVQPLTGKASRCDTLPACPCYPEGGAVVGILGCNSNKKNFHCSYFFYSFIYIFIYLFVCLSVYLFVLFIDLCIYLFILFAFLLRIY